MNNTEQFIELRLYVIDSIAKKYHSPLLDDIVKKAGISLFLKHLQYRKTNVCIKDMIHKVVGIRENGKEIPYQQYFYNLIHDLRDAPNCVVCGKPCRFISISKGYYDTCGLKCANGKPERQEKIKKTNLVKYGTENVFMNDDIKLKSKQTVIDKYGVDSVSKVKQIREKAENTMIERYGAKYTHQSTVIGLNKNISASNIGKVQDKYLNNMDTNSIYWCNENNLGLILRDVFPTYIIEHDKKNSILGFRPDYYIDSLKIAIEFHGYRHYQEFKVVLSDNNKRDICKQYGVDYIEIPYFIQMDLEYTKFCFSKYNGIISYYNNGFPHGFVHPKCKYPGDFCTLGLERYTLVLSELPISIIHSVNSSLDYRSKDLNVIREHIDPSFHS